MTMNLTMIGLTKHRYRQTNSKRSKNNRVMLIKVIPSDINKIGSGDCFIDILCRDMAKLSQHTLVGPSDLKPTAEMIDDVG